MLLKLLRLLSPAYAPPSQRLRRASRATAGKQKGEIVATTLTVVSLVIMLMGTAVGTFVAQRETRTQSRAAGDNIPGGLCGPYQGGADVQGCGGTDGCRAWEQCVNGVCFDTTNGGKNPASADSCGSSVAPTNPPAATQPPAGGQPTQIPATPIPTTSNGAFHIEGIIDPVNDTDRNTKCNVTIKFVSDGCDGAIRLDKEGAMIAGVNGWSTGMGPFVYYPGHTGSPYDPGTTVTFTGWIVTGPRDCGNKSSSVTLPIPPPGNYCRAAAPTAIPTPVPPTPLPSTPGIHQCTPAEGQCMGASQCTALNGTGGKNCGTNKACCQIGPTAGTINVNVTLKGDYINSDINSIALDIFEGGVTKVGTHTYTKANLSDILTYQFTNLKSGSTYKIALNESPSTFPLTLDNCGGGAISSSSNSTCENVPVSRTIQYTINFPPAVTSAGGGCEPAGYCDVAQKQPVSKKDIFYYASSNCINVSFLSKDGVCANYPTPPPGGATIPPTLTPIVPTVPGGNNILVFITVNSNNFSKIILTTQNVLGTIPVPLSIRRTEIQSVDFTPDQPKQIIFPVDLPRFLKSMRIGAYVYDKSDRLIWESGTYITTCSNGTLIVPNFCLFTNPDSAFFNIIIPAASPPPGATTVPPTPAPTTPPEGATTGTISGNVTVNFSNSNDFDKLQVALNQVYPQVFNLKTYDVINIQISSGNKVPYYFESLDNSKEYYVNATTYKNTFRVGTIINTACTGTVIGGTWCDKMKPGGTADFSISFPSTPPAGGATIDPETAAALQKYNLSSTFTKPELMQVANGFAAGTISPVAYSVYLNAYQKYGSGAGLQFKFVNCQASECNYPFDEGTL